MVSFRVLQQGTMVARVTHTVLDASHSLSLFPLTHQCWELSVIFPVLYLFCLICRLVCLQSLKVICSLRWEILHAVLELNMELNLMWTLKQFFGLSPPCDGIWILALYLANFLIVKCKRCSVITFLYIHQMWFHRIYPSIIHFPLFPFFHIPISLYTFMLSF